MNWTENKKDQYLFGYSFGRNGSLFGLAILVLIVAPIRSIYEKESFQASIKGAWEGMFHKKIVF